MKTMIRTMVARGRLVSEVEVAGPAASLLSIYKS